MLLRLHSVMVHGLIGLLVAMSMVQAVSALPGGLPPPPLNAHGTHDGAHHDHNQAMLDAQSKRDCLRFCLENVANHYLAGAGPEMAVPTLVASAPIHVTPSGIATEHHCADTTYTARGPPGCRLPHSVTGLRGVLLLNARMRN